MSDVYRILKEIYGETFPWIMLFVGAWCIFLLLLRGIRATLPLVFITWPIKLRSRRLTKQVTRSKPGSGSEPSRSSIAAAELDSGIAALEHALDVLVFGLPAGGRSDKIRALAARVMPVRTRKAALEEVRGHIRDLYFEYYEVAAKSNDVRQKAAGELVMKDPDALAESRIRDRPPLATPV